MGSFDNPGKGILGSALIFAPTKDFPIKALIPKPKNINARPLANWFARRVIIKKPRIMLASAPIIMAAKTPKNGLPVVTVMANPVDALISKIPSKPKFTIPKR